MNLKSSLARSGLQTNAYARGKSSASRSLRLKSDDVLFVPARRGWAEPIGFRKATQLNPTPNGRPGYPKPFCDFFISHVHICDLLTVDGYRYISEIEGLASSSN